MSVAVGLTPEMLPMIVTSTLAKGAVLLSRQKVIVKRLDAIQNFGAMDVLCTDKTGTLTQDKIVLARHTDVWGEDSDDVLESAYLNSYYQTGLKNLLDVAVLEHVEVHSELEPGDQLPQGRRNPVRLPAPAHVGGGGRARRASPADLQGRGRRDARRLQPVRHGERDEPLTPDLLARIRAVTAELNEDGLRVVAVACQGTAADQGDLRRRRRSRT